MQQNTKNFIDKVDHMLQQTTTKTNQINLEQLPKTLIEYMKNKKIEIGNITTSIPRFIRLKPQHGILNIQQKIIEELRLKENCLIKIQENFYCLPAESNINRCSLYQHGILYGMDYASSIPVRALDIKQGNEVLQLCSAPGNKSMLMADIIQNIKIVGVEISKNRANIMKNLVKKYKLDDKISIVVEDGLKYTRQELFDRVLIDAECTHEGSLKHLKKFMKKQEQKFENKKKVDLKKQKYQTKKQQKQFNFNNDNPYTSQIRKKNEWTEQDFQQRFLDKQKLQNLSFLQYGLLENGFKLLKQKGILVYSTCSFDQQQNEQVVKKLLSKFTKSAQLLHIDQKDIPIPVQKGYLQGTIRMGPLSSRTGGMFIAKLQKTFHSDII